MRFPYLPFGRKPTETVLSINIPPAQLEQLNERAVREVARATAPRRNVICGHQFADGTLCHSPAGPDHSHPNIVDVVRSEMQKCGAGDIDDAVLRNPAPGLQPGEGPSYAELRAVYGDPADLPPILPRHLEVLGITGEQLASQIKTAADTVRDVVGVAATKTERVDFRDMLRDDAAWSAKARLEKVLGRPYLATALVDQLTPETAAKLADRLESLVSQAVAETEMRISGEVASAVTDKITQISVDRAARAKQLEEARRERFARPTRLD